MQKFKLSNWGYAEVLCSLLIFACTFLNWTHAQLFFREFDIVPAEYFPALFRGEFNILYMAFFAISALSLLNVIMKFLKPQRWIPFSLAVLTLIMVLFLVYELQLYRLLGFIRIGMPLVLLSGVGLLFCIRHEYAEEPEEEGWHPAKETDQSATVKP